MLLLLLQECVPWHAWGALRDSAGEGLWHGQGWQGTMSCLIRWLLVLRLLLFGYEG
jgi:hypothetical protein